MTAVLLDDARTFVRRFVVLDDRQADAVALWAAHTHASDSFGCTPYMKITSPEKRSGKTRLLEALELLAREPLPTANISDAALFRVIDAKQPTLLIDEADAVFGKKSPREELRGMLNAGYRRGATTHRMGGANNTTLQTFSVFCPKAFAGIGDCLPDTISDRAIPVRLKRRTRNVTIERFRLRDAQPQRIACATGWPSGWSRTPTSWPRAARNCQTSSTTVPRTCGSRYLRSLIWPGATGPSERGRRRSRSPVVRSATTTPSPHY
jgi:hypothetical protein